MALINCPKCGREMSDRAVRCPQCGMSIEEIMAALQGGAHENTTTNASLQAEEKKRMPAWAWALVIAGVLLLAGGIVFMVSTGTEDKEAGTIIQNKTADEEYKASLRQQFDDYSGTLENVDAQQQEAVKDYEKRLKQEIIDALQGTWEWRGQVKITDYRYVNSYSKLVVNGDVVINYVDGEVLDKGDIRDVDIDNGIIRFGRDSYMEFDKDNNGNLRLYMDKSRGMLFKKATGSRVNVQDDNGSNVYTFRSDHDVYEYLSSHRFSSSGLTLSFRNGGTVLYSNGNQLSNALTVYDFNSRYAILTYTSPYSPGKKTIRIDNVVGTLTDDGSGDVYYSR